MAKEFSLDEAFGPPKDNKEKREFSLAEAFGPPPERTKTEVVTDVAAPFVSGIGSLLKVPGQIYGLTTGAIKDKDFSTTGLQAVGTGIEEWAKKQYSEKLKAEQAETERKVAEAEKEGQIKALTTGFGEVVSSPTQLPAFIAEQAAMAIPTAITAAIPGVGPAAALELRTAIAAASKLAKGTAAREAADAAVKIAADNARKSAVKRGTTAAIGTGAVQQGADIGEGSFQEIKDYLIREKKMSEEQASNEALNLARATGVAGAGVSLLAQKLPGAKAFERALAGEKLGTGRLMGAATGALKNIPDELVEELGGKVSQNVAMQQVNPEQSLTAGLGSTAAQALLGATAIGGGVGALSGGKPAVSKQELQEAEDLKRRQELTEKAKAEREEISKQLDITKNPLGQITPQELGPVLAKRVEEHRLATGKPTLTAYSLEDVIDALPAKNRAALSAGQNADLNALIGAKTGYTAETYTADDLTNVAKEKNIDVTTQGFEDFLKRSTGISDPVLMSQPQLHAAITSLQKLPAFKQTQSLPEGSNATRYSDEQYNKAIEGLNTAMDNLGADELGFKQAASAVEKATGLKDSAVNALVNDAVRKGDIVAGDKKVSIPSRSMPSGYNVDEKIGEEEETADSYDIMRGDEKLFSAPTEEGATKALESLQRTTDSEVKRVDTELKSQQDKITKSEDELNRLTIEGKFGTPEYTAAEAKHQELLDASWPVIAELTAKKESYETPLSVAPVGTKKVKPKTYTVRKGERTVKEAADRAAAEEEIFKDLTDQELQDLSKKRSPALLKRVNAEIQRRASEPKPEPKKLTPELEQKRKALEENLPKLLAKFGLQDVALKIMDAIDNDAEGSYAAKVIQLALDVEQPVRVLRHESLHALKALGFFTPQQWAALEREAEAKWVNKYLKSVIVEVGGQQMTRYEAYANGVKDANGKFILKPLSKEAVLEEAIADAFADFDVNKAPPGMISALLNKLRNFFSVLKSYLNGQGYEKAEDIFTKIEKGELKATQPTAEGEAKLSLIRPAVEGETEISTRNPQGVKRTNDPIAEMLSIDEAAVREAMKANPDMYKRTIQAIKGYGFVPLNTPTKDVIEVFKRNIVNNLLYLYNKVPPEIRERSKLWYDGANRIATDMSKNYKVTMEQVAGIMAAMSPQKDWFQNVSMAERALDILTEQGNKTWDENMLKYAESYVKEATSRKEREKRQLAFDRIKKVAAEGTTLNNMTEDNAAAFIRAYDEAYNSRQYRIVTPEGGFGGLVLNNDGKPATMMWSTYDPIKKTVSIFRDGSRKNISEQLGEEHKIRSFYNNIAAPNSDIGHVTIDTHAVAAGLFEALAGTDEEVVHNFGGTGKNINLGVGGTYGIIADAYREAAQKMNVRAREMQSITWEAVRGLFGENIKSTIKPKIRTEWSKYKNGEQSFDETREKVMKIAGGIDNPDWVGSGAGDFVSDGGASYDKAFTPEGGVRLREAKDIREKLTFNLSAVTNSIPGLRELYERAMNNDKDAYTLLQKVAESNLKFLLSKTNAKISVDYAKGVYLSDREPSISVSISFAENEMANVMAALAKFAESYNQQQIHVRQETAQKFGHEFGDGSYATAVYEIDLKKQLNNKQISHVIDESGLQGFTITDQKLTAYFVRTEGNEQDNFKSFGERIKRVHGLVGDSSSRPKQTIERLYVYGEGYGARIPYSEVSYPASDIRTEQKSDTVTPKLIAEYLTKAPVTTFKQKPLNAKQVKEQKRLAKAWEEMPVNDLKNPLVKRAYTALANSLKDQFRVMPIKVELMESIDEPYANSDAVRRDVSLNNRFKVYATTPETFGPPGSNFKNHPLLKDSGLKDVNGKPMLYNDLLRAVHDYFAHNLTETQFGPNGEAAAWRNHMAITPDPFARWALTSETRGQNAWQNFRPGVEGMSLLERGFADQKAALPPLEFVMTGDAKVDQPVTELKELLTPEQQRGSVPVDAKYSLKTVFRSPEAAENAAYKKAPPTTEAFKRWFGKSKAVEEGRPMVMYHASPADFNTFFDYKPIFISPDPKEAEFFGRFHYYGDERATKPINIYPLWVRAENSFDFENPKHVDRIHDALVKEIGEDFITEQSRQRLASGDWSYIEDESVQQAIKDAGFDSFYVLEGDTKNLAVFGANQVKSATGNSGEFGETKDMRFSLRTAKEQELIDDGKARQEIIDSFSPDLASKLQKYMDAQRNAEGTQFGRYEGKEAQRLKAVEGRARNAYERAFESEFPKSDITAANILAFAERSGRWMNYDQLAGEEPKLSLRVAPDTPEFKRWFGDSKVVDEDGQPLVVYHGSPTFKGNQFVDDVERKNRAGNVGGFYFTPYADEASDYAADRKTRQYQEGSQVVPVYLSIKNPYIAGESRVTPAMRSAYLKEMIASNQHMSEERATEWAKNKVGFFTDGRLPSADALNGDGDAMQRILKVGGYDGFKDGRHWIAFDPTQIKSATGNVGTYDVTNPDIRRSLRVASDIKQMPNGVNAHQSIIEKTTAREEEGFISRILNAISPEGRASFRQKAINRYEGMSVSDKKIADQMGGIELLADASAEAAALQSDTAAGIAAAAMGYGDSQGGVPVYEKGYTTISDLNGTVKGLTEILRPLAVHGDPFIYRAYQFYAGVKRGTRLMADGKEKLFDKADIQYAKDLEQLYPEFKTVQQEWTKYNDGLVDYMVKTGVLTTEKGRLFKKYGDYVPFYRQLEGEETIGPSIFQSMSGVKQPKKIKGGEAPLADFLETVVRNTQAAIQAGTKNVAAQRAINQALTLGTAGQLPQVTSAPNTVTILENGVPTSYAVFDKLLFDSMQSLHLPEMPFLSILSAPADFLRNMVTKDPGFMLANLMRDSLSAYVTSGANMTPLIDTFANFGKVMAGRSPEFQKLINAGVIGGYEFSRGVPDSGEALGKDLRKKTGTLTGTESKLRPITSLWDFLEKGTEASDAATRIAVYKDVMNRTGNEAEAIRRALEVMNFNRKGSSPIIRVITAAIPFLNARIQGLDVFYRAGFAPRPEGVNKTDHQKQVQKNMLIRAGTMMALSSMYWFMMKDDDEYKKQEQEVRDNNWLLPGLGVRMPIPFEVGVLFKVVPERLCAYFFGTDTGEDLAKSMERALRSTFAVNYIPQTVLPLVEATTNYSYFTMRPIVGQGMEGVRPGLQTGPGTTKISEAVGKAINTSPILIDHIIQGYTGTMGMYLVNAVDSVIDVASETQKPSLRPDQYPIVKRFMMNPEAKGSVTAYYELKGAVDETVRTMNLLEKTGRGEDLTEFMQGKHRLFGMSNAKLYGVKDYISSVDKNLKVLQDAATKIRASKMSPQEKQEALTQINMAQIGLTKSVFSIKGNLSQ